MREIILVFLVASTGFQALMVSIFHVAKWVLGALQ